jgi:hypothetical protein
VQEVLGAQQALTINLPLKGLIQFLQPLLLQVAALAAITQAMWQARLEPMAGLVGGSLTETKAAVQRVLGLRAKDFRVD